MTVSPKALLRYLKQPVKDSKLLAELGIDPKTPALTPTQIYDALHLFYSRRGLALLNDSGYLQDAVQLRKKVNSNSKT